MTDYVDIGPSPHDEPCTQAGRNPKREVAECRALRNQIRRILGTEPAGARLVIKQFYTGGGYRELVCEHDGTPDAVAYALRCESECPAKWDLMALVELTAGLFPIVGDGAWKNTYEESK